MGRSASSSAAVRRRRPLAALPLALLVLVLLSGAPLTASALEVAQDATGAFLQGSFVWCPDSPAGTQAYTAFRGVFALPADVPDPGPAAPALLYIFADTRYTLFADGAYVSRGPGRFNPSSPDYDTVDVTAALAASGLAPGQNHSLTVLVHTIGSNAVQGRMMSHAPGLTARLEISGTPVFSTNSSDAASSWRCSSSGTEYQPSAVAWSSLPDTIDGRRADIRQWTATSFDDSAWSVPVPINGKAWGPLAPRNLPMPVEKPVDTASFTILPSSFPLAASLPITLLAGESLVVNMSRMAMVYASMTLDSPADGSSVSLSFALRYINGAPVEDYGTGTAYTARAGSNYVLAGDTWVGHYLTLTCTSGAVTLTSLNLTERQYPFIRVGSFASSDPFFDAVWDRAATTLAVVTDDAYGSDARERNEWLQDPAEPNFITTSIAFVPADWAGQGTAAPSDARLLRLLLRHAALTQQPDGRILATFPTDRGPSDCHWFIEDYAAQWVEALRWYYEATNDGAFVQWAWPVLEGQMAWFAAHVNTSTGLLLAREYTSFDDPLAYITVEGTALNGFYFASLNDAAYLARTVMKNATASAAYSAAAAALSSAMNSGPLWNAQAGTYNSGLLAGEVLGPTPHAAMIALQRGVVPADRVASVQAYFLAKYGNPGTAHVCSNPDFRSMIASEAGINMTVSHYWALEVLYSIDTPEADAEALERVRGQWGNMIVNAGDAGTLWEAFTDSESCHNYGATPAWFLSSRVLGVRVSWNGTVRNPEPAPVLRAVALEPRLGDLTSASGTVVTPLGSVTVSWKRTVAEPLTMVFSAVLPPGLNALTIRIPDADPTTLVIDGVATPAVAEGRYAVANLVPLLAGDAFSGSISMLAPPPQRGAKAAQRRSA